MSLVVVPVESRWSRTARRAARSAVPVLLLAVLGVLTWWAGPLFLLVDLFLVAAWRAPDPALLRAAIWLLASSVVLLLVGLAALVWCARGRVG